MAIDPRISLSPAPTINVGQRFGQALSNLQNIDLLNQRRDIAPLQLEQAQRANELGIAQQPAQLQAAERAGGQLNQAVLDQKQMQQLDQFHAQNLFRAVSTGDTKSVMQTLNSQMEQIKPLVDAGQLPRSELNEIVVAQRLAQSEGGLQQISDGLNKFFNPKGSLATKSFAPIKNPVTGQMSIPTVNQTTGGVSLEPIEGAFQPTQTQEDAAALEQAKALSQVEIKGHEKKKEIESKVARKSALIKEFSTQTKAANQTLMRTREIKKIAEKASQGVAGQGKLLASKFFSGIDASDEGALASGYLSLTMAELAKFTGPTTDFEFGVSEQITGSLGQSAAANAARIASLSRAAWFAGKEAKQFNQWIDDGHNADRFNFNFDEAVTVGKGDSAITFTLQDLRDTAAANHMTIDETMREFKKGRG